MSEPISIDDLDAPQFSSEGQAVLARYAANTPKAFTMDAMLKSAEERLDVKLFRDEYMLDNLDRFNQEGEENGPFTEAGRTLHFESSVTLIMHRSRLEALFHRHPEIAEVNIDRPVIIAGVPRSATTNLSNLMSADSQLNSLFVWEASVPIPDLSVLESGAEDTRESMGQLRGAQSDHVTPYSKNMLDLPYNGTIEEILLMGLIGMPLGQLNTADNPRWRHWFWHQMEPESLYVLLRRTLQALQWIRGNDKRWVLKSPHHLAFLPTVKAVFPDARFIITHRDPASSLISNATMIAYLQRRAYATVNLDAAYNNAMDMGMGMLGGLVRDIDKLELSEVHHVYFHDYMSDVIQTLKTIYQAANLPWTDRAESELRAYIDDHPRGRFGRLQYNPERDFGKTRVEIRAAYQFYLDKFPNVQIEGAHG